MEDERKNTVISMLAVVIAAVVAIGAYFSWAMQERKTVERREGIEIGKTPWLHEWMGEREIRIETNEGNIRENRDRIIDHLKEHPSN